MIQLVGSGATAPDRPVCRSRWRRSAGLPPVASPLPKTRHISSTGGQQKAGSPERLPATAGGRPLSRRHGDPDQTRRRRGAAYCSAPGLGGYCRCWPMPYLRHETINRALRARIILWCRYRRWLPPRRFDHEAPLWVGLWSSPLRPLQIPWSSDTRWMNVALAHGRRIQALEDWECFTRFSSGRTCGALCAGDPG